MYIGRQFPRRPVVSLEDVQNRPDSRGVGIDEVGISGIRYPITVWDRDQGKQTTIADIAMSVGLLPHVKGTHLSRFVELVHDNAGELTQRTLPSVLARMQERLGSETAQLTVSFPYFMPRSAPVTGATALMDYDCQFRARSVATEATFSMRVRVPVSSVCPCSKAISDYGAHNQRGLITIEVWPRYVDDELSLIWIEELVEIAESSASSPVYPLLKRADERHVTMQGYDNPVFVEDMVRNVAVALNGDSRIAGFTVDALNDESIHNHAAYARIEQGSRENL
jgi:GTP cyclohydrolase I